MTAHATAPDVTTPQGAATTTPFSLSVLTVTRGNASKQLLAGANGHPIKGQGSLAITAGMLERVQLAGLDGLKALLMHVRTDQALVHGVVKGSQPGDVAPTGHDGSHQTREAGDPDTGNRGPQLGICHLP